MYLYIIDQSDLETQTNREVQNEKRKKKMIFIIYIYKLLSPYIIQTYMHTLSVYIYTIY